MKKLYLPALPVLLLPFFALPGQPHTTHLTVQPSTTHLPGQPSTTHLPGQPSTTHPPITRSKTHPVLPQLGKDPLPTIVAAMTLEEKASLVVGLGFRMPGGRNNRRQGASPGVDIPSSDPKGDSLPEKVPGAAGRTHAILRLGIPSTTVTDGPAGIRISPIRNNDSSRTYYATAFPVATLLASTWDTALVSTVGKAFGNEVHEYGSDILLGPAMNIHRNPLGGRNFEYYSEDPLVSGSMAAAMVEGIQSNGVGTSIKHFVANNQETDRNTVNTLVSQRALREIYLRGFEIAVKKANPWTVMSSYNLVNGTYTSQDKDLLTTILRDEWHFKGFVMSDWFGGDDPVAQMKAGNDLLMPGNPSQSQKIVEAVKNGTLDPAILDRNVTRILQVILLSPEFKKFHFDAHPDLKAHAALVRKAAAEGMVLLKNDANTLPLKNITDITLLGNYSYDLIAGGTGSGDVNKPYTISLAKGLTDAGFHIHRQLTEEYERYIAADKAKRPKGFAAFFNPAPPPAEMPLTEDRIEGLTRQGNVAILTIGRNAGEGRDRKVENDFDLTDGEKQLIATTAKAVHAQGKKLVVVLNIGGVIETASWRDMADAILLAWQPGLEGGHSIADILTGKIDPSGRLATTFPIDYKDVPSADNFPGTEFKDKAKPGMFGRPSIPAEVIYKEGIFVGYRYYETFKVRTAYPFGYGLSYTSFTFGPNHVEDTKNGTPITVSFDVTNTGAVAGREVVQVYITAPTTHLAKPAEELKAFAKTRLLQPGQKETMHFTLRTEDLASFDEASSSWVADAGDYTVRIGVSADDIRNFFTVKLPATVITEKVHNVMSPLHPIEEMKK